MTVKFVESSNVQTQVVPAPQEVNQSSQTETDVAPALGMDTEILAETMFKELEAALKFKPSSGRTVTTRIAK